MSNQDLINAGYPRSGILPGNQYWKANRSFRASEGILNYDRVITNPGGSRIILNATRTNSPGGAGIIFGASEIKFSRNNDSIIARAGSGVQLSQIGLDLEGTGYSFFSPTAASLELLGGRNLVAIGGSANNWQTGLRLGTGSRLRSGGGDDTIRAIGTSTAIDIEGSIMTGGGNDVITGLGRDGGNGIYVFNSGMINTGRGADRINAGASGSRPFYVNGRITMGAGNDVITGRFLEMASIDGSASINMGPGNDEIKSPVKNVFGGSLAFGAGTDRLSILPGTYTASIISDSTYTLSGQGIQSLSISGLELLVSSSTQNTYRLTPGIISII